MASPSTGTLGCTITVKLFDGTRQPIAATMDTLITLRDGNQRIVYREFNRGPALKLTGLPFFNNFGDYYTVLASADDHEQAGFTPVKVSPNQPQQVDLMLLRKGAGFNFAGATWEALQFKRPMLADLLAAGAPGAVSARERYVNLIEDKPDTCACLLNLTTAMAQILLPSGTPLDYFRELIWDDTMKCDRFFAWAAADLVDQVRLAAQQGIFAPEPGTALFHPGATSSFKQVQFGEANIQITFHENDRRTVGGAECIKVEPDMDYFKDTLSHALLEVLPNSLSGSLTDPRSVYLLRWIAGRRAGVPEFDPLYTIA